MTSLLDLPPDALLHLSTLLSSHHDLVALGSSCRVLRECVNQVRSPPHTCQLHRHPPPPPATATSGATSTAFLPAPLLHAIMQDSVWRTQCEAWLQAQCSPSNGLAALTAPAVLEALGVGSYRLLCQTLHRLGSWPAGVFYATSEAALPRGRLLVGQLHPPSGSLRLQQPRQRILGGAAPSEDSWELQPGLSLRPGVDSSGTQVDLSVATASSWHHTIQLSLDGQSLLVHRCSDAHAELAPAPGSRTLRPPAAAQQGLTAQALSMMAAYLGVPVGALGVEVLQYRRASLPAPADLQAVAGEPPGMALLRQCQVRRCPQCCLLFSHVEAMCLAHVHGPCARQPDRQAAAPHSRCQVAE